MPTEALDRVDRAIVRALTQDGRMSVAALAERVHLSPRHLTRLFRQQTGVSIVEYQQRLRVARVRP